MGAGEAQSRMAPTLGLEPRTYWLTASHSTIELYWNNEQQGLIRFFIYKLNVILPAFVHGTGAWVYTKISSRLIGWRL